MGRFGFIHADENQQPNRNGPYPFPPTGRNEDSQDLGDKDLLAHKKDRKSALTETNERGRNHRTKTGSDSAFEESQSRGSGPRRESEPRRL